MQVKYKECDLNPDECTLCEATEKAQKDIPDHKAYSCCNCGAVIKPWISHTTTQVIGDDNGAGEDQTFRKRIIITCDVCSQEHRMELLPVMYNGNHDVYYTGEKSFIPLKAFDDLNLHSLFMVKVEKSVTQWLSRRAAGENLAIGNLALWITYDLQRVIVELVNNIVASYKRQ